MMNALFRPTTQHTLRRLTSTVTRRTLATSVPVASTSATDGPPSVLDSIVQITFIDPSGARRQVPAYVGTLCNCVFDMDRLVERESKNVPFCAHVGML